MKNTSIIALLALGVAGAVFAQDAPERRPGERPPGGPGGERRPMMPLMQALDPNNDGVIDATEIAQASANLKKLDKNNDGKITREELRPAGGRPGGPGGPEGERRRPAPEK
jgi:hypothetical protein